MGILEGSPVPETYAGPVANQPWWGTHPGATFLPENLTGTDMMVAGGIDWLVSKRRLFPEGLDGEVLPNAEENWVAVHRDTDNAFLGMVTPSYHTFQNGEMVEMTDKVLGMTGAHYHTAGSLYGGKLVWVLAEFDGEYHIKGDGSPHRNYLLGITGHTGRHALTFVATPVRVWCGNTAAAAVDGANARINLRHTSGMGERVAEVQKALDLHVKYVDTYEAAMNRLAVRDFDAKEFRALAEVLTPVTLNDGAKPEVIARRIAKAEAKRDAMTNLFIASPTLDGVSNSAYRALQAVIEYVDHYDLPADTTKASGNDRQATSLYDGDGYDLKSRAAALLGA